MNDFTKGEWSVKRGDKDELEMHCLGFHLNCVGNPIMSETEYYPWCPDNEADWHLFAAAGTAATKLAEQGYDAVKMISLLPQIAAANSMNVKVALIKQCEVV